MQSLQERMAAQADLFTQAKARGHWPGAWHWVNATTVQSRCIYCNAGITLGEDTVTLGLDEDCFAPLSDEMNLIKGSYYGTPTTYD